MVKKYILSIDNEAKEYFDKSLLLIEKQLKEDVLGTALISSNKQTIFIVERNIKDFLQTTISLIEYYIEGIYDSGKNVSRKKLKLERSIPENGKKYSFTHNDQYFIDKYKSNKLTALNIELEKAVVNYVNEKMFAKIYGEWIFDGDDDYESFKYKKQELIDDTDTQDIINIVKNVLSNVFDEVMDILAREILVLFRRAQIEEYKNLGINATTIISEDESLCCPVCTAKSGKVFRINEMIEEYEIKDNTQHSFCKFSIDPVISYSDQITTLNPFSEMSVHMEYNHYVDSNSLIHISNDIKTNIDFNISSLKFTNVPIEMEYRIVRLVKKFQMYAKQFLRDIEFIFVNDICEENDWFQEVKNHYILKGKNDFEATNEALIAQDKLKYKVASFDIGNKYYVSIASFDSQLVEEIITRKLVKDLLEVDDLIKETYEQKLQNKHIGNGIAIYQEPFMSYLAEESPEDYLLESVIGYVNQPKKLQGLDAKIFDYIKEKIFNGKQFFQ